MGKATVENALRIDARHWAGPERRRAAEALARLLRMAQEEARAGRTPEHTGLIPMEWTRGWDKSPAGSIRWGVLEAEGDRATRLLLLFATVHGGQMHPRRQEVVLSWESPSGRPSPPPVFLCPFCGRRCRYLCSAYPGRRGGPYLGEFACRECAGLCYQKQLEYRSAWAKNFETVMALAAKARAHPERLTWADLERMEQSGDALRNEGPLAKFTRRVERIEAKKAGTEEPRRQWDLLPPPLYAPPKHRGRPSKKRQRQQERECAQIVRQAERDARPKRPSGRPKQRRAYNAMGRQESGCAGRLRPGEGYCVGCRAPRRIADATPFMASNGRAGVKGRCAECGRGLCRMGATLISAR